MRHWLSVLTLLWFPIYAMSAPLIVENGDPRSGIVIADDASKIAHKAASELQTFIEMISGAQLPICTVSEMRDNNSQTWILVGPSKAVEELNIPIPKGYTYAAKEEGFVLRTIDSRLIVAGNDDDPYQGTLYAVYDLLERLGCRWYFPGEFGQVIPKQSTIALPDLNITSKPSFPLRNIWLSGWADRTDGYEEWCDWNKMNRRIYAFPGDGSIRNLAPPDEYFEEHPEIYALSEEGERVAKGSFGIHGQQEETMLCLSNPLTVEIASKTICDYFKEHPEINSYGFSPPDGAPRCFCDDCVAGEHGFMNERDSKPSLSDTYFNFVNNIAWKVCEEYPDRYIVTLAYSNRVRPPEGLDQPFHPNIIVQIARLGMCAIHPIDSPNCLLSRRYLATIKAWSRIAPQLMIYDYDPHADLSRFPFWNVHSLRENMPLYHKYGVIGFTTEAHNTFLRTGLNYYIRAKLMWDVNADVDALLDDFYKNFFGPAAGPMKHFIESIESMLEHSPTHLRWTSSGTDWPEIFDANQVNKIGAYLDQAEALGKSEEVLSRIRAYRAMHQYMHIYLKHVRQIREGDYQGARESIERLSNPIQTAEAIQSGLLPPDGQYVIEVERGTVLLKERLKKLLDRTDGTRGERLKLAHPKAAFRTDPYNEGLYEQWHRDSVAETLKWNTISLNKNWYLNGYHDAAGNGYLGYGWYRFPIELSEIPTEGPIKLYLPMAYGEKLWVWVNEQLVHFPADEDDSISQIDIDITGPLKVGKNTLTFRFLAAKEYNQRGGFSVRPLFWVETHPEPDEEEAEE